MVSKINNQQALEILSNTKASHFVNDLKAQWGRITFIFKKYCPCFFKTAKAEIKQAEIKDKMPAEIQKTAAKVIELAQGKFIPAIIGDRVINNEDNSVAVARGHKAPHITATEHVNKAVEKLSSQVISLANAYNKDLSNVTAFIGGMNGLLRLKGEKLGDTVLDTLTGISFTGIHAIRAEAKQFAANNNVEAIISGFDAFIAEMQKVSPDHQDLISAHIHKTLAESVGDKFATYKTSYNEDAATEEGLRIVQKATSEGDRLIAERKAALDKAHADAASALLEPKAQLSKHVTRANELRGPNGFNGAVHEAWLGYMKSISQFILAVNENVDGDGKLSETEVAQLKTIISNREALKEAEAFLNGILSKPNFGRTNLALFSAQELLNSLDLTSARQAQMIVTTRKADFEKLRDELNSLTGKGQNMSLRDGQYNVTADSAIGLVQAQIRRINGESTLAHDEAEVAVQDAEAKKVEFIAKAAEEKANVATAYIEKTERATEFFARLERVKEALKPIAINNPYAFNFGDALRS
jgi:hypothetical protein